MAEKEKTKMDEGKMEEPLPESFPRTPPPFTDGFMRETEQRYSNHRKSLAWLVKIAESEDIRRKAKEMLEGRRSVYEVLRDPEFGRMADRSIERLQQVMKAESIDPSDPSTFPDRKRLAELVGKYGEGESLGRGEDAKDDEADRRRAAFDRRRRSDEQHKGFGAGRR